jgi:hypothetical protein
LFLLVENTEIFKATKKGRKTLAQISSTLVHQLDGNAGSISDCSNEQALLVVDQLHGDANSTDDTLQEQYLRLVKNGVYPLVGHGACMISISSCEWHPHGKKKL